MDPAPAGEPAATATTTRGRRSRSLNPRCTVARAPRLHETRSTLDALRASIELQRAAELQFEGRGAAPPPDFSRHSAVVKLNTAAILREEARLVAAQQKQAAAAAAVASGGRDATDFLGWRAECVRKEQQGRAAAVELRRAEDAAMAQRTARQLETRRRHAASVVESMRAEGELIEALKAEQRVQLVATNRALADDVRVVEFARPAAEVEAVLAERKAQSAAVKQELASLSSALAAELAADAAARAVETAKLRALELARPPRPLPRDSYDPTTVAGSGVLEELSLAELKQRVAVLQGEAEAAEAARRDEILAQKEAVTLDLEARARWVFEARAAAAEEAARARAETRRAAEEVRAREESRHAAAVLGAAASLTQRAELKAAALASASAQRGRSAESLSSSFFPGGAGAAQRLAGVQVARARKAALAQAAAIARQQEQCKVDAADAANEAATRAVVAAAVARAEHERRTALEAARSSTTARLATEYDQRRERARSQSRVEQAQIEKRRKAPP